jgi:microsomal dipeptidase-like Zn-dependent dipeptidase
MVNFMKDFQYADLHCHPNLKTFGHSFDKEPNLKSDLWHSIPPSFLSKLIYKQTGITKFSQSDFTTMARSKAKIGMVGLYPFEKGFFDNKWVWDPLAAILADFGIEIGYRRIRNIQKHKSYFKDLIDEYNFVLQSNKEMILDGKMAKGVLVNNWSDIQKVIETEGTFALIMTIEGAHVFESGLEDYGKNNVETEILGNIRKVKEWEFPPFFVGLAHNFNNDLCGHAESLQRLGSLVNQKQNMGKGLSELGRKVIFSLLDKENGKRILIDIKHMSLKGRLEFYDLLEREYASESVPLVISHGAVTGKTLNGRNNNPHSLDFFNENNINFFDEEIIKVVASRGIFAIQMDLNINCNIRKIKSYFKKKVSKLDIKDSAKIIWNQIQHFAFVCDRKGLFAWGNICLGTDFDGSIFPFPGILTAKELESLSHELVKLARDFQKLSILEKPENHQIYPEEIIERFMYKNIELFLKAEFN